MTAVVVAVVENLGTEVMDWISLVLLSSPTTLSMVTTEAAPTEVESSILIIGRSCCAANPLLIAS